MRKIPPIHHTPNLCFSCFIRFFLAPESDGKRKIQPNPILRLDPFPPLAKILFYHRLRLSTLIKYKYRDSTSKSSLIGEDGCY